MAGVASLRTVLLARWHRLLFRAVGSIPALLVIIIDSVQRIVIEASIAVECWDTFLNRRFYERYVTTFYLSLIEL